MRGLRTGAGVRTALAAVCLGLLLANGASALPFTVTSAEDDGIGTLRAAIEGSNTTIGSDTIDFMLGPIEGTTIELDSDLDTLSMGNLTIDGTGLVPGIGPGPDLQEISIDGGNGGSFLILGLDGVDVTVVDVELVDGKVTIGEDDTLTFTANRDFEVSSEISNADGGGSLSKDGDATLTLSGSNTFNGTITIDAGTLVGDTDSLRGDIANEGLLVFDQGDTGTYSGLVSGAGSFEKSGDGTLTLDGANTFTGGTTISAGALSGTTVSIQGNVEIADEAQLIIGQSGTPGTFAGDITGAGKFIKAGDDDLTLGGNNSYSGGTTVEDGALIGDTAAIQGDVELMVVSAKLEIAEEGSGTLSGVISGAGAVVKSGAGSARLMGANAYTGTTTVEAGTLIVDTSSLPGINTTTIDDSAILVFDQQSTGEFEGVIDGTGGLEKQGGGVLVFDTMHTYTGGTQIIGGTLELGDDGELASFVNVESGGTLSGSGAVKGTVTVRGTLSPGSNGPDVLDVDGEAKFEADSVFVVDFGESVAEVDRLDATGTATIDGTATLVIEPAPGSYDTPVEFTVLNAATFADMTEFLQSEPFAFLDREDIYGAGTVAVRLSRNPENIGSVGTTANQRAVGSAIGTLDDEDAFDELFDNLITLTVSEAGPALDALSGEAISGFTTARLAMGERFQRMLHRRMRSVLFASDKAWPATPPGLRPRPRRSAGPTDVAASRRLGESGIGSWIDGYGILGDLDGDGNSEDLEYDVYGASAGLDVRLGSRVLVGASAGYARTEVEVDDRWSDGDADSAQGALYAAYASPLFYAGVSGRYAWTNADSTRKIDIGTISTRARGDFDSHDFGARGELAINAFEARDVRLQPLVGFEWSHLTRESFDESESCCSLGLDVDSEDLDTALLQLGARLEMLFVLSEDAVFTPELRAFWLHEFGDRERQLEATIGGTPFSVNGAEAPRDGGLFGVGWGVSLGTRVRASANYDVRIDSDRLEHTGNISVHVRF